MSAPARAGALPVGATIDRGFALLRRQPRSIVLPAVVLHVAAMLAVLLLAVLGVLLIGDVETTTEQVRESTFFGDSTLVDREVATLTDGQWVTVGVLAGVGAVVVAWFSSAAYAAMILAARRVDAGTEPRSLGAAIGAGVRAAPRLLGLLLVVAAALVVAAVLGWFAARGLFRAGGLMLMGLGGLVGVVLATVVAVRLMLVPVVALIEGRGFAAFGRTWRLTAGAFWPLLGLALLLAIVVTTTYVVATLLLEALLGLLNALDTVLGSWLLVPYAALVLVLSVVYAAAFLAPLVVAHRSLVDGDGDAGDATVSPSGEPDASLLGARDRSA